MNLLPGSFSVFGGLTQGMLNTMSNYASNNANKEAIAMSNRFNREMWELEQEYNSPLAQMKRLQEAGINPAFAYSSGVSNTVSSAPTATPPIANQPYLGNELAEIGNRISLDQKRNQENDESKSRIALNKANVLYVNKNTELTEEQINNAQIEYELLANKSQYYVWLGNLKITENERQQLQLKFEQDTYNDRVEGIANDVGISSQELKFLTATYMERCSGVTLTNDKMRQEIEKLRKENSKFDDYMNALTASVQANADKTGIEYKLLNEYGKVQEFVKCVNAIIDCADKLGLVDIVKTLTQGLKGYIKNALKKGFKKHGTDTIKGGTGEIKSQYQSTLDHLNDMFG